MSIQNTEEMTETVPDQFEGVEDDCIECGYSLASSDQLAGSAMCKECSEISSKLQALNRSGLDGEGK